MNQLMISNQNQNNSTAIEINGKKKYSNVTFTTDKSSNTNEQTCPKCHNYVASGDRCQNCGTKL